MKKLYRSWVLMVTFVTRIPLPIRFEIRDEDFAAGYKFFPIIGLLLGFVLNLPFLIEDYVPETLLAFFIIILYLLLVGGLHMDGVSDVFDSIFSARDREKMLVIMEDSRVGAFGVIGLILAFMGLYLGLLEVVRLDGSLYGIDLRMIIIGLTPFISRTIGLITAGFSSYAKPDGFGKVLIDRFSPLVSISLSVLLCVVSSFFHIYMTIGVVITILISQVINYRIHKLLGGITGDVIGMMIECSQIIFLISAAVLFQG